MKNLPFELIASYLDIEKVHAIDSGALTKHELLSRFKNHLTDEEKKMLLCVHEKQPKHIENLIYINTLKERICTCPLMDPRTKAILYTFLERGGLQHRDLYLWFIYEIVQTNLEIRPAVFVFEKQPTQIPQHHLVWDNRGSFRIHLYSNNQVIGFFDRCLQSVIAHPRDIDLALKITSLYILKRNQTHHERFHHYQ